MQVFCVLEGSTTKKRMMATDLQAGLRRHEFLAYGSVRHEDRRCSGSLLRRGCVGFRSLLVGLSEPNPA